MTSIVRRNSSFFAVVKSVINFRAAFEKEHGVFLLAAHMVDIVEDTILSDFPTGDSPQTYKALYQGWRSCFLNATIFSVILKTLMRRRR